MKKAIGFLAMLAIGGLLGYLGARFFLDGSAASESPKWHGVVLLILLPVFWLLSVGIHELGHVVFGLRQHFSFHSFTVGPFAWNRNENDRIQFNWNKNLNVAGGVAVMLPKGKENLSRRFIWFAAGGPLMSILLTGLCFLLYSMLPVGAFVRVALLVLAGVSALIFVVTIFPFRTGGFASDGLRMLTFWRGGPLAEADLANLVCISMLKAGEPYTELPAETLAATAVNPEMPGIYRVSADYYLYLHALDRSAVDEAEEHLTRVLDNLHEYPTGLEGGFYLEQALFAAKYRQDLSTAKAAVEKFSPNPLTENLAIGLAEAAIAELENDSKNLAKALLKIEGGLSKTIDQSRVPIIKEWLKEWRIQAPASF